MTYTVNITVEAKDEMGNVIGYEGLNVWEGALKSEANLVCAKFKADGFSDAEVREYN